MSDWDISRIRRIAGLPQLNESYDGEDDDPDAKVAASDPRQRQFERSNRRGLKDAEREAAQLAAKKKESKSTTGSDVKKENKERTDTDVKKEEHKPAAEATPSDKDEKPKAEGNEAKSRHREGSKTNGARGWLQSNPTASRKEFMAHVTGNLGITAHHANTMYYMLKKKLSEGFIFVHPYLKGYVLAENQISHNLQWIDATSPNVPLIVETIDEAKMYSDRLSMYRNQSVIIEKVTMPEEDCEEEEETVAEKKKREDAECRREERRMK